jgi:CheY-like chemotaxis protein
MEALNFIKAREDIDAVLLDVMMPEMDGYATCRRSGNSKPVTICR